MYSRSTLLAFKFCPPPRVHGTLNHLLHRWEIIYWAAKRGAPWKGVYSGLSRVLDLIERIMRDGSEFQEQVYYASLCYENQCFGSGFIESGSGSSILGWKPIWIQSVSSILMTKNRKKFRTEKSLIFFLSKIAIQHSKENILHFQKWIFLTFFYFSGSFLPSWIGIHWPDWIRIKFGSGSEAHENHWL